MNHLIFLLTSALSKQRAKQARAFKIEFDKEQNLSPRVQYPLA